MLAIPAEAAIEVSGRHVYILYEGMDELWGNYLFLVGNTGTEPEEATVKVMLPRETIDWQGNQGIGENELMLGEGGGLILKKSFPPGESLISIGFKVPASMGSAPLSFQSPSDMSALSLFVQKGGLSVDGAGVQKSEATLSGDTFDTYTWPDVKAGSVVEAEVTGLSEGRGRFWMTGGVIAVLLLAGAVVMTMKTRKDGQDGTDGIEALA